MVGCVTLFSRSHSFDDWVSLQSGDASEQGTTSKVLTKAPTSAASAAAENVKSFVAGGFGGVCAVLVGSWVQCATPSRFSHV